MDMHDSECVMTWTIVITYTSNTFKKFLLRSYLHYYYIQTIYNGKEESISNIFITYVEPLLNDINNDALAQECKINLNAVAYEKNWF